MQGKGLAILAFGSMLAPAIEAAQQLNATLVNMRFVKPLDSTLLLALAARHTHFVTVEENVVAGGAGSAVNEYLHSQQVSTPVLNLGLPDRFVEQGSREECLAECGLDSEGVIQAIRAYLETATCHPEKNTLAY